MLVTHGVIGLVHLFGLLLRTVTFSSVFSRSIFVSQSFGIFVYCCCHSLLLSPLFLSSSP